MTERLRARLPSGEIDPEAIARAAEVLRAGGLVAMPTETVYGLAANALSAEAVGRIYAAKGRPSFNPLIVHVASVEDAAQVVASLPDVAHRLAEAHWPGPLTLVLPKDPRVPDEVTGGLDTVGIRLPAHPVARRLLEACGLPLAAPSANRSGHVSPTSADHVARSLGERVDVILDDGSTEVGIESTVLDLTTTPPAVLRPGGVTLERLRETIPDVVARHVVQDTGTRASPGLLARHYAPDAETRLVDADRLADEIAAAPPDARIGVIVRDASKVADPRVVAWEALGTTPETYARGLYAALHRVEGAGCTHVLIERLPSGPAWDALRDRVLRAATPA